MLLNRSYALVYSPSQQETSVFAEQVGTSEQRKGWNTSLVLQTDYSTLLTVEFFFLSLSDFMYFHMDVFYLEFLSS